MAEDRLLVILKVVMVLLHHFQEQTFQQFHLQAAVAAAHSLLQLGMVFPVALEVAELLMLVLVLAALEQLIKVMQVEMALKL